MKPKASPAASKKIASTHSHKHEKGTPWETFDVVLAENPKAGREWVRQHGLDVKAVLVITPRCCNLVLGKRKPNCRPSKLYVVGSPAVSFDSLRSLMLGFSFNTSRRKTRTFHVIPVGDVFVSR